MKWKKEIKAVKIDEKWCLEKRNADEVIIIDEKYALIMEAMKRNMEGEKLIQYLCERLCEHDVEIGCMLAEFYIQYMDYIQNYNTVEFKIEA